MTLPFKGALDDYGSIEHFEEDENTRLIEGSMGMSIKDLTYACIWGEEIPINNEKHFGAGCFIHADIYERFSRPVTGGKYAASMWSATFAASHNLEAIGCKLSHEVEGRYKYVYKHPSIKGISFHSDGNFTHVIDDSNGKELYGYGLKDMQKALRKSGFSLFPLEDVRRTKHLSELQASYKSEAQRITQSGYPFLCGLESFRLLGNRMSENLLEAYIDSFAAGKLLDRIEQLTYLLDSFNGANRMLIPTITDSQYPEHSITSVITGSIDKIAKKRLTEARQYLIGG
jgi:hypothetical protein